MAELNCEHDYFESDKSTIICRLCGVERRIMRDCTWNNCGFAMRHSPFLSGYSRTKRFRGMVEAIFWPTPTNGDSLMLEYLLAQEFNNRKEIIQAVTAAPLKDKRFGSIHLFCRLFNPEYIKPVVIRLHEMLKRLVWEFQILEARFKQRIEEGPFINYSWLIGYLFTKLECLDYLKYVKELKCEKRKKRYMDMVLKLEVSNFSHLSTCVVGVGTLSRSALLPSVYGLGLCARHDR